MEHPRFATRRLDLFLELPVTLARFVPQLLNLFLELPVTFAQVHDCAFNPS